MALATVDIAVGKKRRLDDGPNLPISWFSLSSFNLTSCLIIQKTAAEWEGIVGGKEGGSGVTTLRREFPLLGTFVAPRTPTEQTLAEIFRDAFSMDQVSVTDGFEELGGDSLIALTICADIEKIFAVSLSTAIFERSPTIEQLAPKINELASRREA